MATHLEEYERILQEELNSYKTLEGKIETKRSHLIKGDIDNLVHIDMEINHSVTDLNRTINQRKKVSKLLGSEKLTLKEIIEQAKSEAQKRSLAQKRKNLKDSATRIERLNKVNDALIKQGLFMIEKSISNIAKHVAPQTRGYSSTGKASTTSSYTASSIIKDA